MSANGNVVALNPSRGSRHGLAWTTGEERTLRDAYARGGIRAAVEALPGRSRWTLVNRAVKLGVRSPRQKSPTNRGLAWTGHMDAHIRRKLAEPRLGRGVWADLERDLGRPRQAIQRRALDLGLTSPRVAPGSWSEAEDGILQECQGKGLSAMQRALARAGFSRTQGAISGRLRVIRVSRAIGQPADAMNAHEVAVCLGVGNNTVAKWIESGGLKARPLNNREQVIRNKDLRAFLIEHPEHVHLGKVEAAGGRYWLIDLLGRAA